jgi:hypothetical protein
MTETILPPKITDGTVSLSFGFIWDGVTYPASPSVTGAYFGYCTINDVDYEFANLSGFKSLSSSVVAQEICYGAIELQETLQFIYSMPYSGTNQNILTKLREMNAKLAFARLVDRYYTANSPNHSEAAALKRDWVNHQVGQLIDGVVRWDTPFGDAVGTARLPVFNRAAVSGGKPDPNSGDSSADPIFSLTAPGTRGRGSGHF